MVKFKETTYKAIQLRTQYGFLAKVQKSIHNTKFHAELFCPLLEMKQTATSFKICSMFDFSAYLSQDIMQIVFTLAFNTFFLYL